MTKHLPLAVLVQKWSESPSGHPVTIAVKSWGNAAYALSNAGAHFLADHMNVYKKPLDVQLSELQDSGKEFVAISACNNDRHVPLCPENITNLDKTKFRQCNGSGTTGALRSRPLTNPTGRARKTDLFHRHLQQKQEARPANG